MIGNAPAIARTRKPDIDDPWLLEAIERSCAVQDQCRHQHPKRLEDEEQFGCQNRVDDEEAVSDAGKHLRTRQRHEQPVTFKLRHNPVSRSKA